MWQPRPSSSPEAPPQGPTPGPQWPHCGVPLCTGPPLYPPVPTCGTHAHGEGKQASDFAHWTGGTAEAGLGHEPGVRDQPGQIPDTCSPGTEVGGQRGIWWPGHPPVDREHFKAVDVQHTNDCVLAIPAWVPTPCFHDTVDPVHHPLKEPLVHCLGRGQAASVCLCPASSRKTY